MIMKLIKGMIQHVAGRLILLAIILLILIIAEGIRYHSPKEEIERYRKMEEERQEDSWMEENDREVAYVHCVKFSSEAEKTITK